MERPDNETIERQIIERFFEAVEHLKAAKKVRSLRAICEAHKLNYPNIMRLKYPDNTRKINNVVLWVICNEYGISLDYVIGGKGSISSLRVKKKVS